MNLKRFCRCDGGPIPCHDKDGTRCIRCGKPLLHEYLAESAQEARRQRSRLKRDVRVIRGGFRREGAEVYRPKPWTGEEAA